MRLSSLLEQIADVLTVIQQRIVEPIVDGPVQLAEFVGVWEQIVDVPVPRTTEDDVDQIVGIPVPQLMEAVVEVTPQERMQNRMPVQIVDVPVPQIMEATFAVRTTGARAESYA